MKPNLHGAGDEFWIKPWMASLYWSPVANRVPFLSSISYVPPSIRWIATNREGFMTT
jgi:hypothetical protein